MIFHKKDSNLSELLGKASLERHAFDHVYVWGWGFCFEMTLFWRERENLGVYGEWKTFASLVRSEKKISVRLNGTFPGNEGYI